jgi:hypothetical protein
LVTDGHVDTLTVSGTITEVTDHVVALLGAGIDRIIIRPFAPEGGTLRPAAQFRHFRYHAHGTLPQI